MDLSVLLGKPPKMTRDVRHVDRTLPPLDLRDVRIAEAAQRVLRLPAVADKTFLISIGDRTVGGLCSRDQFVGPWQVPVADVAVTLMGFRTFRGEAMAMGERAPVALIDPPASGRMAIGEAITNIAAASIGSIGDIKLSANWMAAAGCPGEDAALYDTVRAVGMELCPRLGISIPVGKDSMSMQTTWRDSGQAKQVIAPLSLIVSAFAPVLDVRRTLTPQLQALHEDSVLLLDGPGRGTQSPRRLRSRSGASASSATMPPDLDEPEKLKAFFSVVQALNQAGKVLAYHDRSDGGLFATLCEMMFASHVGVTIDIDN